jgi:hypothetical protein
MMLVAVSASVSISAFASPSFAATGADAQARITHDLAAGHPVVIHVIVALCDNLHQGIVPVPKRLGNGQDARSNLYWGAAFGVRLYIVADAWDGAEIKSAIQTFLTMAGGDASERVSLRRGSKESKDNKEDVITAGGSSHVVAFVGHDGLMDFSLSLPANAPRLQPATASSTVSAAREAAAVAYNQFQKCGLPGARKLFWGEG